MSRYDLSEFAPKQTKYDLTEFAPQPQQQSPHHSLAQHISNFMSGVGEGSILGLSETAKSLLHGLGVGQHDDIMPVHGIGKALLNSFPNEEQLDKFGKVDNTDTASSAGKLLGEYGLPAYGAAKGLYSLGKSIPALLQKIKPQSLADSIREGLGNGQSITQTRSDVASAIKNNAEKRRESFNQRYSPYTQQEGIADQNIYPMNPFNGYTPQTPNFSGSEYKKLGNGVFDLFKDKDLINKHQEFLNNPTVSNAHLLQSDLGKSAFSLNVKDSTDRTIRDAYLQARNALRSDLNNGLKNINPSLSENYKNLTSEYSKDPYLFNKQLNKIISGEKPFPNVANLFGAIANKDTIKVANDLGPDIAKKIIYSHIGHITEPDKLANAIRGLDKKGLDYLTHPSLKILPDALEKRISNKELAQKLGKYSAIGAGITALPGGGYLANKVLGGH